MKDNLKYKIKEIKNIDSSINTEVLINITGEVDGIKRDYDILLICDKKTKKDIKNHIEKYQIPSNIKRFKKEDKSQKRGRTMAVITIATDTTWTTDQTNTDGYIVNAGATLTIDARTKGSDLQVVHGTGNAGSFVVQNDGAVVIKVNNSARCIMGGADFSNPANATTFYGSIVVDDTGDGSQYNTFIGADTSDNKTQKGIVTIQSPNPRTHIKNTIFRNAAFWQQINHSGEGYFKNCIMGNSGGSGPIGGRAGSTTNGELWVEDCTMRGSNYRMRSSSGDLNIIGTLTAGQSDNAMYANIMEKTWTRFFLIVDDGTDPVSGAKVSLIQSDGFVGWTGITDANGKIDATNSQFGLDYLLALKQTVDDVGGTITYGSASKKHTLLIEKAGFATSETTYDMSSDQGTAASPTTVSLTAFTAPVISSQQLDGYSLDIADEVVASCSVTNMTSSDEVYLEINGKVWKMDTTDNASYTKTLSGSEIGTVTAGVVKFVAVNSAACDEENAASNLTVTATQLGYSNAINRLQAILRSVIATDDTVAGLTTVVIDGVGTKTTRDVGFPRIHVRAAEVKEARLTQTKFRLDAETEIEVFSRKEVNVRTIGDAVRDALKTKQYTGTFPNNASWYKVTGTTLTDNIDDDGVGQYIYTVKVSYQVIVS